MTLTTDRVFKHVCSRETSYLSCDSLRVRPQSAHVGAVASTVGALGSPADAALLLLPHFLLAVQGKMLLAILQLLAVSVSRSLAVLAERILLSVALLLLLLLLLAVFMLWLSLLLAVVLPSAA